MKLLILVPDGETMAGVQCRVLASTPGLQKRGFEVGVLAGGNPKLVSDAFEEVGIPFFAFKPRLTPPARWLGFGIWLLRFPFLCLRLWHTFRDWNVIHIHGFMAGPLVVLCRLAGRKVVWHLIGNHVPEFLVRLGVPILKKFASRIVLVAPSMATYYGLKRHEYTLIWEPCWTEKGTEISREHFLRELNVEGDANKEIWMVGVGHLVPAKNWPLWIEVASSLPVHYRFFIFGKEVRGHIQLKESLLKVIDRKKLRSRFHVSYDPEIRHKLHLFDVMLCTSKYEGTPLTLLEAQAHELRVVARNTGGVADIVPESSLVNGDSPEDFRRKIEEPQSITAFNVKRHGMETYLNAISECFRST